MVRREKILVKIDSKTKHEAEKILKELGIMPNILIYCLYKRIIMTGDVPFDMNVPFPEPICAGSLSDEEIMEFIQEGIDDVKEGRTIPFEEAKAMFDKRYRFNNKN